MRKASLFGLLVVTVLGTAAVGCGAPVDNTQNRADDTAGDPNYPAGPYGYVESSTVANYKFLGKEPMNGVYGDTLNPLLLGQFHDDPSVKLLLVEGSANWCYFCNIEASTIEQLATDHAAEGFRVLTVLAEGAVRGVPSTGDDINDWVTKHNLHNGIMGIDPEQRLFQYAPTSAFPLHILLDARTMKIQWLCVGGTTDTGAGCPTESTVTDALGAL